MTVNPYENHIIQKAFKRIELKNIITEACTFCQLFLKIQIRYLICIALDLLMANLGNWS